MRYLMMIVRIIEGWMEQRCRPCAGWSAAFPL